MNNRPKQIGLLGGTFDPVHNGHLGLAEKAIQAFDLDKVLFIPANQSPHKIQSPPTASMHRIAMLRLALKDKSNFPLELLEINRSGISYTIDTISQLKIQHPDWELYLILGADAFLMIDTWKNYAEIFKCCHLLVSTRPGINLEVPDKLCQTLALNKDQREINSPSQWITLNPAIGKSIRLFQIPPQDISSKIIRGKVQTGKEIKNLLPPAVDHYIMKNRLYRTESPPIEI
ncbi:MAG: nicotinate-nucleotide adenylyltransferase [Nitrospinaceae bacterium]|jgi:nicotinate-nucleotide adenylyltransferase|nr:nicotinate-nucleotide adenylyltransferase [Nitrospinaceae bacterium]MBT6345860.1 nicotinate-nucleotide adenylyltransferase [Nitrospina sp.]